MSQTQPRRPQAEQASNQEGIKYGYVFDDTGGLQGVAPSPSPAPIGGDAGWTNPSPTLTFIIDEDLGWITPTPTPTPTPAAGDLTGITIGKALETVAISVGDKPVDQGDAAAIRTAEAKAAGSSVNQLSSGLGATAQDAATFNARVAYDYNKITMSDVLSDAASKLPRDKPVTSEDADGVRGAELSKKPDAMTTPGGVADTMATAARVNREDKR